MSRRLRLCEAGQLACSQEDDSVFVSLTAKAVIAPIGHEDVVGDLVGLKGICSKQRKM